MNIMELMSIIEKQIKFQGIDDKISIKLSNITFQEITKEFAFEVLKLFIGKESAFL